MSIQSTNFIQLIESFKYSLFDYNYVLIEDIREIPKKFRCFCCTELSNVWNIFHFFITILISGPVYRNITTWIRPGILLHRIDPEYYYIE